jgi:hypothetical protein
MIPTNVLDISSDRWEEWCWEALKNPPTLADYLGPDEPSNVEESEAGFYEASKKFAW